MSNKNIKFYYNNKYNFHNLNKLKVCLIIILKNNFNIKNFYNSNIKNA